MNERIIVHCADGSVEEYERGVVFGFNHEKSSNMGEIDLLIVEACPAEVGKCQEIIAKKIKKEAEKELREMLDNGDFEDVLRMMARTLKK